MLNGHYKMNTLGLYQIFNNEEAAFNIAIQNKMIYNEMICENCNCSMSLITDRSKKFNMVWKCRICRKKISILKYSIFSCSHYKINNILHLLYCWSHQFSGKQTTFETNIPEKYVSSYNIQFRYACLEYLMNIQKQIGGNGKIVEIDETLMCRRKYHKGRLLNQVWIFGGICIDDKEIFAVIVPDRKTETLEKEILEHIAPGSIIISDSWNSYNNIENLNNGYHHLTVNHSENFVDPDTGADTQEIERLWREMKMCNKKSNGINRCHVYSHIGEFIWRRNEIIYGKDPFLSAIELMANTVFFSPLEDNE